jgi:hypothetical protein
MNALYSPALHSSYKLCKALRNNVLAKSRWSAGCQQPARCLGEEMEFVRLSIEDYTMERTDESLGTLGYRGSLRKPLQRIQVSGRCRSGSGGVVRVGVAFGAAFEDA